MLRPLHVMLGDRIDPALPTPIYLQVISAIIRDIERGRLAPGSYLPGSRQLAAELNLNRKTVVLAYEELIAQGWLEASGTRGTMVATTFPDPVGGARGRARENKPPEKAQPQYRILPTPSRPLALPGGPGIKLDEGAPDGRLFPNEVLVQAYRSALLRPPPENHLQYRDPFGTPRLRSAIADMLRHQRGLAIGPEDICITRGSQNGLFLTAQALIRPGDAVIVEELTYEPALAAFRMMGAKLIPVPFDGRMIDIAAVEQACRNHKVRAIFLTPHHQFPTTAELRPERRLALVNLAKQFGFAIIEDDYDHEFHFASQPLLPMAAYAPDHVIYLGSLSKLIVPALRVGYVVAPEPMIRALGHYVSLTDGMGNTVTEDAVAELITSGALRRHARKVRKVYGERRERFAEKLREVFGDRIAFETPNGGLAFWLRFPGIDIAALENEAQALGLRFAASESFLADPKAERGLRIGFASLNAIEADSAIKALARALDRVG
ncbi:PLP-dependent aminotransferase family protein [Novosphingobium sp. P6W]|uniref:MocR-like pyridoxine biosynthesis transcription factor PdxR n=1 Tax=Novosphingobium sp. P6W TaxID=1609758 RepID=UPI0005C2FAAE|nr:PLP-dependent aminotransferase family protein [Novosphingobium sp. P6W]AXB79379.1 PLP-dependent aminotransferase family protein [Novosphingobium sp. P6W]KIS34147.1 GntR family transcriptional regulator [Novosphingobium sp. P6W]